MAFEFFRAENNDAPIEKEIVATNATTYKHGCLVAFGEDGTAVTSSTNAEFVYTGKESSIITDVTAFDWIYGGGRGGSSSNIWYTGNMLKFGTTTNKGSITLSLSTKVVGVKVKGYATNTACNVTIGDSNFENKRQTYSWSEMTIANIETVTANQASLIEMRFEATDSLIIAVTTAKPIYITSIEFIFE